MSDAAAEYFTVKKLYETICNRELGGSPREVQQRVEIVQRLEKITGKEFRSTKEFHQVFQAFLENKGKKVKNLGARIKAARKKRGWTLKQLADFLVFKSHTPFILYEQDKRIPPKVVIDWLLREGGDQVKGPILGP